MPAVVLTDRLSIADYRRRSRQVRARYVGQPGRMYQELTAISGRSLVPAEVTKHSKAGDFARLIASKMDGSTLRYSARLALLRQAEQTGIDRFEANLIIAAVVHRADTSAPDQNPMETRTELPPVNRNCPPPWKLMILTALATQAVIFAGAWLVFWR